MVLTDFIKVVDLPDLDVILKQCMSLESEMSPAITAGGYTDYRSCKEYVLIPNAYEVYDADTKLLFDNVENVFQYVINEYITAFPEVESSILKQHSGFQILKYEEDDNYQTHVDDFKQAFRRLSISIVLNDNFKGGDLKFFNKEQYTVRKNQAIVFPSSWQYPHQVTPVTEGTRWAIVIWTV